MNTYVNDHLIQAKIPQSKKPNQSNSLSNDKCVLGANWLRDYDLVH